MPHTMTTEFPFDVIRELGLTYDKDRVDLAFALSQQMTRENTLLLLHTLLQFNANTWEPVDDVTEGTNPATGDAVYIVQIRAGKDYNYDQAPEMCQGCKGTGVRHT